MTPLYTDTLCVVVNSTCTIERRGRGGGAVCKHEWIRRRPGELKTP